MENEAVVSKVNEFLVTDNVVVRDKENFKTKLSALISDGAQNLQIVTDFDDTLTKYSVDGKKTANSFEVFSKSKTLSKSYLERGHALAARILSMAYRNELEPEEQQEVDRMLGELVALSVGEQVSIQDVHESIDLINVPFKDGCSEMLGLLSENRVPIIIVSAGSGDVIKYMVRDFETRIISNFMIFKDGHISDFVEPRVGVFNKNTVPLPVDEERHNVILLGDMIGDAKAADNISNVKTLLKIGFLYKSNDSKLRKYLEHYDVLLLDDESIEKVTNLIRLVIS